MALDHPSFEDFIALINAELRRQLPSVDPTVFGSWARGFTEGAAALATALGLTIRDLERQLFPQTAEGVFLERWGGYEGLSRNPASAAFGNISIPGTVATSIPVGTQWRVGSVTFEVIELSTIQAVSQTITTLVSTGTTATATTSTDHNLATGMSLSVTGANESVYNQSDVVISVAAANQFQYTLPSGAGGPATGSPVYNSDFASAQVRAETTGQNTNVAHGGRLNIVNAIPGVDGVAFAQFAGLAGGADLETDDSYSQRILLSRSIQEGVFTPDQVQLAALGVPGNTRAFVVRPGNTTTTNPPQPGVTPSPGQVVVYILRDNDDNIIPTQQVLDQTKTAIIANGALPAHSGAVDVGVFAPTPISTDFVFTALTPDTPTMRTAIQAQLAAFFEDQVQFQVEINQNTYLAAIQNTQDPQTGDLVESFTLSAPTGNIAIGNGQIGVLGDVTFNIT